MLDRSTFDPGRIVAQLAEPALDGPARSPHCALFNVRYVCPCARARPRLLRLCVVLRFACLGVIGYLLDGVLLCFVMMWRCVCCLLFCVGLLRGACWCVVVYVVCMFCCCVRCWLVVLFCVIVVVVSIMLCFDFMCSVGVCSVWL